MPRLHSALRATPFPPSPRRGHFPIEGRGKGGSAVLAKTDPVRRTPKIKTYDCMAGPGGVSSGRGLEPRPVSQRLPSQPSQAQPRTRSPGKGLEVPHLHPGLRAYPFPASPGRRHFPEEGRDKGEPPAHAKKSTVQGTPKVKAYDSIAALGKGFVGTGLEPQPASQRPPPGSAQPSPGTAALGRE